MPTTKQFNLFTFFLLLIDPLNGYYIGLSSFNGRLWILYRHQIRIHNVRDLQGNEKKHYLVYPTSKVITIKTGHCNHVLIYNFDGL
ncbi:hypothetical protein ACJRO7_007638 [Eucalyptus globulus]|uniref:Uncharacterized protein n=1 Tax=Eucalyptus globulus TaxID=34317 RepID=A0ABD3ILQ5_EUCGL